MVRIASWSNILATRTRLIPYRDGVLGTGEGPFIPRGAGRSFGDAAYVGGGDTVCSSGANLAFSIASDGRTLTCASGAPVGELQKEVERAHCYWAVFGGTQWVTAGGAVASDIHSKAIPDEGSCGNHVEALTVVTPDGVERPCSRDESPDLFAATIGGMGMTGYIKQVTFRLQPPRPCGVRIRAARFETIAEMKSISQATSDDLQVVEWVDLTRENFRGIVWRARYVDDQVAAPPPHSDMWLPRIRAFYGPSVSLIEHITLRVAGTLDTTAHRRRFHYGSLHERFRNWNRLYGRRGFIEYHFCVPDANLEEAFRTLARLRRAYRAAVFFGAGKRFSDIPRAGLMSFPMDGWGVNFQTPESPANRCFLVEFGDAVAELGGRIYLAKDAVATPRQLERMYPRLSEWQTLLRRYDPCKKIQSDLSRRLELKPW